MSERFCAGCSAQIIAPKQTWQTFENGTKHIREECEHCGKFQRWAPQGENMAKHLMLDFETLGQNPDTAVLSLGAVGFDKSGILGEKYWLFDLRGQVSGRRTVSADTIAWWMGQGPSAKDVFEKANAEGIMLKDFIPQFLEFYKSLGDARVWGNGATFDVSIIEHILMQQGRTPPWKFWNVRCYRTMKACFGIDKPFEGIKHNALDDAKHQANCLVEYWKTNPAADK